MDLTALPVHILLRVCQYLLDDPPSEHPKWISDRIKHVLNLRATNRYLNDVVKQFYLKFGLSYKLLRSDYSVDALECSDEKRFLSLINEFNWCCTELKIRLVSIEGHWLWVKALGEMLLSFESIFKRKINFLEVDAIYCFNNCSKIIRMLAPILSNFTEVNLKICVADFQGQLASELNLHYRVTKVSISDSSSVNEQKVVEVVADIYRCFPNAEELCFNACRCFTKGISVMERVSKVDIHEACGHFDSTRWQVGTVLPNVKHLVVGNYRSVSLDHDMHFISTCFINLTYLDFGFDYSMKRNPIRRTQQFDLPRTCVTVKINLSLLNCITKCKNIKHLKLVLYPGTSKRQSLIKTLINEFEFELEIFVLLSQLPVVSYVDCFEEIVKPLIGHQSKLTILAFDFRAGFIFDAVKQRFICDDNISSDKATEIEQYVARMDALKTHQHLKLFRLRNMYLVLKLSLDKQLINFIDYLDMECGWSIRKSRTNNKFDHEKMIIP